MTIYCIAVKHRKYNHKSLSLCMQCILPITNPTMVSLLTIQSSLKYPQTLILFLLIQQVNSLIESYTTYLLPSKGYYQNVQVSNTVPIGTYRYLPHTLYPIWSSINNTHKHNHPIQNIYSSLIFWIRHQVLLLPWATCISENIVQLSSQHHWNDTGNLKHSQLASTPT